MQQAKALKEQVDTPRHREEVLKACVQPWIDKAFIITTIIEGKIMQMQGTQEQIQGSGADTKVLEQCV